MNTTVDEHIQKYVFCPKLINQRWTKKTIIFFATLPVHLGKASNRERVTICKVNQLVQWQFHLGSGGETKANWSSLELAKQHLVQVCKWAKQAV